MAMNRAERPTPAAPSLTARSAAFGIHLLTASGAGIALLALLEAVREHWAAMFGWLGLALLVDAIDGPLARKFDVLTLQPNWSGEALDFVVDFVTYVFVPSYAILACGLVLPVAAPLLGVAIVVTSALYFADRRMKTDDNHFRGFPALWNAVAFYLLLLRPSPIVATIAVGLLIVLTFVPIRVVHPVRVARLRILTLALMALWAVLAAATLLLDFNVGWPIKAALCAIAAYVIFADTILRSLRPVSP